MCNFSPSKLYQDLLSRVKQLFNSGVHDSKVNLLQSEPSVSSEEELVIISSQVDISKLLKKQPLRIKVPMPLNIKENKNNGNGFLMVEFDTEKLKLLPERYRSKIEETPAITEWYLTNQEEKPIDLKLKLTLKLSHIEETWQEELTIEEIQLQLGIVLLPDTESAQITFQLLRGSLAIPLEKVKNPPSEGILENIWPTRKFEDLSYLFIEPSGIYLQGKLPQAFVPQKPESSVTLRFPQTASDLVGGDIDESLVKNLFDNLGNQWHIERGKPFWTLNAFPFGGDSNNLNSIDYVSLLSKYFENFKLDGLDRTLNTFLVKAENEVNINTKIRIFQRFNGKAEISWLAQDIGTSLVLGGGTASLARFIPQLLVGKIQQVNGENWKTYLRFRSQNQVEEQNVSKISLKLDPNDEDQPVKFKLSQTNMLAFNIPSFNLKANNEESALYRSWLWVKNGLLAIDTPSPTAKLKKFSPGDVFGIIELAKLISNFRTTSATNKIFKKTSFSIEVEAIKNSSVVIALDSSEDKKETLELTIHNAKILVKTPPAWFKPIEKANSFSLTETIPVYNAKQIPTLSVQGDTNETPNFTEIERSLENQLSQAIFLSDNVLSKLDPDTKETLEPLKAIIKTPDKDLSELDIEFQLTNDNKIQMIEFWYQPISYPLVQSIPISPAPEDSLQLDANRGLVPFQPKKDINIIFTNQGLPKIEKLPPSKLLWQKEDSDWKLAEKLKLTKQKYFLTTLPGIEAILPQWFYRHSVPALDEAYTEVQEERPKDDDKSDSKTSDDLDFTRVAGTVAFNLNDNKIRGLIPPNPLTPDGKLSISIKEQDVLNSLKGLKPKFTLEFNEYQKVNLGRRGLGNLSQNKDIPRGFIDLFLDVRRNNITNNLTLPDINITAKNETVGDFHFAIQHQGQPLFAFAKSDEEEDQEIITLDGAGLLQSEPSEKITVYQNYSELKLEDDKPSKERNEYNSLVDSIPITNQKMQLELVGITLGELENLKNLDEYKESLMLHNGNGDWPLLEGFPIYPCVRLKRCEPYIIEVESIWLVQKPQVNTKRIQSYSSKYIYLTFEKDKTEAWKLSKVNGSLDWEFVKLEKSNDQPHLLRIQANINWDIEDIESTSNLKTLDITNFTISHPIGLLNLEPTKQSNVIKQGIFKIDTLAVETIEKPEKIEDYFSYSVRNINIDANSQSEGIKLQNYKFTWSQPLSDQKLYSALQVPGSANTRIKLVPKLLRRDSEFEGEIGLFTVDDKQGNIGDLTPNHKDYLAQALSNDRQLLKISREQEAKEIKPIDINNKTLFGVYLIPGGTAREFLNTSTNSKQKPKVLTNILGTNSLLENHVSVGRTSNGYEISWRDEFWELGCDLQINFLSDKNNFHFTSFIKNPNESKDLSIKLEFSSPLQFQIHHISDWNKLTNDLTKGKNNGSFLWKIIQEKMTKVRLADIADDIEAHKEFITILNRIINSRLNLYHEYLNVKNYSFSEEILELIKAKRLSKYQLRRLNWLLISTELLQLQNLKSNYEAPIWKLVVKQGGITLISAQLNKGTSLRPGKLILPISSTSDFTGKNYPEIHEDSWFERIQEDQGIVGLEFEVESEEPSKPILKNLVADIQLRLKSKKDSYGLTDNSLLLTRLNLNANTINREGTLIFKNSGKLELRNSVCYQDQNQLCCEHIATAYFDNALIGDDAMLAILRGEGPQKTESLGAIVKHKFQFPEAKQQPLIWQAPQIIRFTTLDKFSDKFLGNDDMQLFRAVIYFEEEQSEINNPDAYDQILGEIKKYVVSNSDAYLRVEGYATKLEGNFNRTLELSEARADAVKKWLTNKGQIPDNRILTYKFGDSAISSSIGENDTPRVEIIVLENVQIIKTEIYFEKDETDVPNGYEKVIETIKSEFNNNPRLQLRLEGHASKDGEREYNWDLSQQRAISVNEWLKNNLPDIQPQVHIYWFGEEEIPDELEDQDPKNRRVDIFLETVKLPDLQDKNSNLVVEANAVFWLRNGTPLITTNTMNVDVEISFKEPLHLLMIPQSAGLAAEIANQNLSEPWQVVRLAIASSMSINKEELKEFYPIIKLSDLPPTNRIIYNTSGVQPQLKTPLDQQQQNQLNYNPLDSNSRRSFDVLNRSPQAVWLDSEKYLKNAITPNGVDLWPAYLNSKGQITMRYPHKNKSFGDFYYLREQINKEAAEEGNKQKALYLRAATLVTPYDLEKSIARKNTQETKNISVLSEVLQRPALFEFPFRIQEIQPSKKLTTVNTNLQLIVLGNKILERLELEWLEVKNDSGNKIEKKIEREAEKWGRDRLQARQRKESAIVLIGFNKFILIEQPRTVQQILAQLPKWEVDHPNSKDELIDLRCRLPKGPETYFQANSNLNILVFGATPQIPLNELQLPSIAATRFRLAPTNQSITLQKYSLDEDPSELLNELNTKKNPGILIQNLFKETYNLNTLLEEDWRIQVEQKDKRWRIENESHQAYLITYEKKFDSKVFLVYSFIKNVNQYVGKLRPAQINQVNVTSQTGQLLACQKWDSVTFEVNHDPFLYAQPNPNSIAQNLYSIPDLRKIGGAAELEKSIVSVFPPHFYNVAWASRPGEMIRSLWSINQFNYQGQNHNFLMSGQSTSVSLRRPRGVAGYNESVRLKLLEESSKSLFDNRFFYARFQLTQVLGKLSLPKPAQLYGLLVSPNNFFLSNEDFKGAQQNPALLYYKDLRSDLKESEEIELYLLADGRFLPIEEIELNQKKYPKYKTFLIGHSNEYELPQTLLEDEAPDSDKYDPNNQTFLLNYEDLKIEKWKSEDQINQEIFTITVKNEDELEEYIPDNPLPIKLIRKFNTEGYLITNRATSSIHKPDEIWDINGYTDKKIFSIKKISDRKLAVYKTNYLLKVKPHEFKTFINNIILKKDDKNRQATFRLITYFINPKPKSDGTFDIKYKLKENEGSHFGLVTEFLSSTSRIVAPKLSLTLLSIPSNISSNSEVTFAGYGRLDDNDFTPIQVRNNLKPNKLELSRTVGLQSLIRIDTNNNEQYPYRFDVVLYGPGGELIPTEES